MTSGRSDLIDLSGFLRARSKLAVLFDDGASRVWLPRSQIEIDVEPEDASELFADPVTVTLPEWLAQEKGLI